MLDFAQVVDPAIDGGSPMRVCSTRNFCACALRGVAIPDTISRTEHIANSAFEIVRGLLLSVDSVVEFS